MSESIRCVHCNSLLRSAEPLRPDAKTRCPKCKQPFTVGDAAAPTAVQPAQSSPPPVKRRYDDEDDDAPPARIKKKKRKPSRGGLVVLLVLLGGGALLALVSCIGCGVGGYYLFLSGPRIAGTWDLTDPHLNVRVRLAFHNNGTGMIDGPGADVHFDYTLTDVEPMRLEWRITRIDTKGPKVGLGIGKFNHVPLGIQMFNQNLVGTVERFRITIENDTLTTTPQNGGAAMKWRRVH
jgi:phage FluMu protein Com